MAHLHSWARSDRGRSRLEHRAAPDSNSKTPKRAAARAAARPTTGSAYGDAPHASAAGPTLAGGPVCGSAYGTPMETSVGGARRPCAWLPYAALYAPESSTMVRNL